MLTSEDLAYIKQSFRHAYSGNAHIQEVIPAKNFGIKSGHLRLLHNFAKKNPIYTNFYEQDLDSIQHVVYEGDINQYWLDSIKHGSSCQPFYPTWITSAYVLAQKAADLGFQELFDIGSGDGRIAFCGKISGLIPHSIEIDETLTELQKSICRSVLDFNPICNDALEINYKKLNLKRPIFFIGGLPQMGGDILADGIIKNIPHDAGVVFAGTHSKRHLATNIKDGGWSHLVNKYNLDIIDTILLPTTWTFDQETSTPYIFTQFAQH